MNGIFFTGQIPHPEAKMLNQDIVRPYDELVFDHRNTRAWRGLPGDGNVWIGDYQRAAEFDIAGDFKNDGPWTRCQYGGP